MCGIAGAAGYPELDGEAVLEAIAHRGPDGQGQRRFDVAGQQVWLGHTRLAILDLSDAGLQPMSSHDGRWWISFNGEIYNHMDLRSDLASQWRSTSDTETLCEALSQWGIDATVRRLIGMYAFAALDTQTGRLHLVRDDFGIKPLYFAHDADGRLAFASEIRALARISGRHNGIDEQALQTFLTLRFVPSPGTMVKGVSRLPPGHIATLDLATGKLTQRCFVEPARERFEGSFDDAVSAYHDVLSAAVRRQMLSDVPVGVLLSGGIDSGLVAAFAAQHTSGLHSYTVGFRGDHAESELDDARETAEILGLEHAAIEVDAEQLWSAVDDVAASVEEPLGTTSVLPMWYLVQRAREGVTVVLTGQGSDEPWGGYRRYQIETLGRLPGARLAGRLAGPFASTLPNAAARGVRTLQHDTLADRFLAAYELFTPGERRRLTGNADSGTAAEAIRYWLDWADTPDRAPVERMMSIDARMNLSDDLLLYGDKISMSVALEARVPILDSEVVRFIESLPASYKVGLRRGKIVHKAMAQRYLPKRIVNRPKRGFQVPFYSYAQREWRERIGARLLDRDAPHLHYVERSEVEKIWQRFSSGGPDRTRDIFALLMLSAWMRQHGSNHA